MLHGDDIRFDVTVIDECIEVEIRERNEIVDLIRECTSGDIEGFINDFLGGELLSEELPDFDIFSTSPVIGINTTHSPFSWA